MKGLVGIFLVKNGNRTGILHFHRSGQRVGTQINQTHILVIGVGDGGGGGSVHEQPKIKGGRKLSAKYSSALINV